MQSAIRLRIVNSWPERNERELPHQASQIDFRAVVLPAQQSAQYITNNWRHESISALVISDHLHRFIVPQESERSHEVMRTDDYLCI